MQARSEGPISKQESRTTIPPDSELPRLATPPPAEASTRRGRLIALGIVLALSFLFVLRIAEPLWVGIAFGTFMAFTAQPAYRKVCSVLGNRRELAAAITTIVFGLLWILVGGVMVYVLSRELFALVAHLQERFRGGSLADVIGEGPAHWIDRLGFNRQTLNEHIQQALTAASNEIATAAGVILQTTSTAFLGIIIGMMTMYYVLLEWPRLPVRLERVLPLDPRHTRSLILEFRDVGRSALIGTIATAAVQGIFGGIGYAICGIPHSVTWGLVTALASLIPAIGTALIWIPMGIYLVVVGRTGWAILEMTWGIVVVVGICDYVIRPRLVGSKGQGHPLLMLIALLGGIEVFGLAGLIVGPVVMSLFVAIMRIYEREMAWEQTHPRR
jgi:predicted PurR-regulated permease PerM